MAVTVPRAECRALGEKQIKWLRDHMPPFDLAYKAVKAADAHAAKVRADLEKAAQ